MNFKVKKHSSSLYNTLLHLSRNIFFYNKVNLKDVFETRIYLMIFHFSIILIIFKKRGVKFPQDLYDELFNSIENNLRELGFGDVGVNKKMKDLNKILYDILLKISVNKNGFIINEKLVLKYFIDLNNSKVTKYDIFNQYFTDFYHFCFVLPSETMLKDALKFKV